MHKNFSEWYRLVQLEPKGESLLKRWAGVKEWCSLLYGNDDAILETVRILQGLPEVTSRDEFLAAFRNHDPAFPQRNELELQILAGAALVNCVQSSKNNFDYMRTSCIAGTALETSRLRVSISQLEEIVATVEHSLRDNANWYRARIPINTELIDRNTESSLRECIKQMPNAKDIESLKLSIVPVLQAVFEGLLKSKESFTSAVHNLHCADEETNILWWLEGGYSRYLNKSWATLNDEVPLIAGFELAELTDIRLGPQNVAAFLDRVLSSTKGKSKAQPLQVYVNAVSIEWAEKHFSKVDQNVLDLLPLSHALSLRAKSGTSNWQEYYEKISGVSLAKKFDPVSVARQLYVESVLQRTLTEAEG